MMSSLSSRVSGVYSLLFVLLFCCLFSFSSAANCSIPSGFVLASNSSCNGSCLLKLSSPATDYVSTGYLFYKCNDTNPFTRPTKNGRLKKFGPLLDYLTASPVPTTQQYPMRPFNYTVPNELFVDTAYMLPYGATVVSFEFIGQFAVFSSLKVMARDKQCYSDPAISCTDYQDVGGAWLPHLAGGDMKYYMENIARVEYNNYLIHFISFDFPLTSFMAVPEDTAYEYYLAFDGLVPSRKTVSGVQKYAWNLNILMPNSVPFCSYSRVIHAPFVNYNCINVPLGSSCNVTCPTASYPVLNPDDIYIYGGRDRASAISDSGYSMYCGDLGQMYNEATQQWENAVVPEWKAVHWASDFRQSCYKSYYSNLIGDPYSSVDWFYYVINFKQHLSIYMDPAPYLSGCVIFPTQLVSGFPWILRAQIANRNNYLLQTFNLVTVNGVVRYVLQSSYAFTPTNYDAIFQISLGQISSSYNSAIGFCTNGSIAIPSTFQAITNNNMIRAGPTNAVNFAYKSLGVGEYFEHTKRLDTTSITREWAFQLEVDGIGRFFGRCDPLRVTLNGGARCPNLQPFPGAICEVVCEPHYAVFGDATLLCSLDGSGTWIGRTSCVQSQCITENFIPENGLIGTCTDINFGSECQYACQDGATLVSSGPTLCSATGVLTVNQQCVFPTCDIPTLPFGAIGMGTCATHTQSGVTCQLQCQPGLTSYSAYCAQGTWSSALSCGTPCNAQSYGVLYIDSQFPPDCSYSIASGSTCTYKCQDGYLSTGAPNLCMNGKMNYTQKCIPGPCNSSSPINHYLFSNPNSNIGNCSLVQHNEYCSIGCDPTFSVYGSPLRCFAGTFSGDQHCNPNYCSVRSFIRNGWFNTCGGAIPDGTNCSFSCDDGYTLVGPPNTCVGTTLIVTQSCVGGSCSNIAAPSNSISGNCSATTNYGQSCAFQCATGMVPHFVTATCWGETVEYSDTCHLAAPCTLPVLPTGLTAGDCPSTITSGATCMLSLLSSSYLIPNAQSTSIMCDDGVLYTIPTPIERPCTLSASLGSHSTYGSCNSTGGSVIQSGQSCTLACETGYQTSESLLVSCRFGVITATYPSCTASPCPLPVESSPVVSSCPSELSSGSNCTYQCIEGYKMVGPATRSCSLGVLSGIPPICRVLPCTLPLSSATPNAVPNTCSTALDGIASGDSCQVACDIGYVQSDPSTSVTFSCSAGRLTGSWPTCIEAVSCPLPDVWQLGIASGTCNTAQLKSGTSCQLYMLDGYVLVDALQEDSFKITCFNGVMSSPPLVVAADCTLPELNPFVETISCDFNSTTPTLKHGPENACEVACQQGTVMTSGSGNFQCSFGELFGTMPSCESSPCLLPSFLPAGLEAGTCPLGTFILPYTSCFLKVSFGYSLFSGTNELSCQALGVLSDLPTVVESFEPEFATDICDTSSNWAFANNTLVWSNLVRLGAPICDYLRSYSMIGWSIEKCFDGNKYSVRFKLSCQYNALLSSTSIVSVFGQCQLGLSSLSDIGRLGRVSCPDNGAVLGMSIQVCSTTGLQWVIKCQTTAQSGPVVGVYAGPNFNTYTGFSPLTSPSYSSFSDLASLLFTPCDYTRYNFMNGLSFSSGATFPTQSVTCIEFYHSVYALSAAPLIFYGAQINERPYLDAPNTPQCIALKSVYIETSGKISAIRFFASNLGNLTFQTYLIKDKQDVDENKPKQQYLVTGQFDIQVTQIGLNYINIPDSLQWNVDPQTIIGFCYHDIPIVPFSLIQTTSPYTVGGYTFEFDGGSVATGQLAGGGDFNVVEYTRSFYSLQAAVTPVPPRITFGYRTFERSITDKFTDGRCLLMKQPAVTVKGKVLSFTFFSYENRGQVFLQTYRFINGSYVLQGSYSPNVFYSGVITVPIPEPLSWSVVPGDVIAHCYTKSSLPYDVIQDDSSNTLNYLYQQTLPNTPNWLEYAGGIQKVVGSKIAGGANIANNGIRHYSLQMQVYADSACQPASRAAAFGHGRVECDTLTCQLYCDEGYASKVATQSCQYDGSWTAEGRCVKLDTIKLVASKSVDGLTPYSVFLSWARPAVGLFVPALLGFQIRHSFVFPIKDREAMELEGINNITGVVELSSTAQSYTWVADSKKYIEHSTVRLQIRSVYVGGYSLWSTSQSVTLICACDAYSASKVSLDAMIYGYPLNLVAKQNILANSIVISFTPNSMCADEYSVSVTSNDNTALSITTVPVKTRSIRSINSCPYIQPVASTVANVVYPLYGRNITVCLSPAPLPICSICSSQYSTAIAENKRVPTYSVCANIFPSFQVNVQGKIGTAITGLSPTSVAVPRINVNVTIVDPVTFVPLTSSTHGIISTTCITDQNGEYSCTVDSNKLTALTYGILVVPWAYTYDPITHAINGQHQFSLMADQTKSTFSKKVNHADVVSAVNFYDKSQVTISGSFQLRGNVVRVTNQHNVHVQSMNTEAADGALYGSTAFQGCGVPGMTITAYDSSDVNLKLPLSRTSLTAADGKFILNVPLYTSIILVPSSPADPTHQFSPSNITVNVEQFAVTLDPFYDVSVSTLRLDVSGGKCNFHIGSVVPTLFLSSCGVSAHIALPAFDESGYVYIVPSAKYILKLYDSHNPASGLQQFDSNQEELPLEYLYGPVFNWVASYPQIDLDLSLNAADAIHSFRYFATPNIRLETRARCSDPLALSSDQSYHYALSYQLTTFSFELTESYGYIATGGTDYTHVCKDVDQSLEILDDATEAGFPLSPYHPNCTVGGVPCVVDPLSHNPTRVVYFYTPGAIELSSHTSSLDPTHHIQPAYSRIIQYRPAGSALPFTPIYVVLLGSAGDLGSWNLPYPPYEPLYILRKPPGGNSKASIQTGNSISSTTSRSMSLGGGIKSALSAEFGYNNDKLVCFGGLVASECEKFLSIDISTKLTAALETKSSTASTSSQEFSQSFSTTIETSDNPNLIDGAGDLFLTVSGSWTFSIQNSIIGSISVVTDPISGQSIDTCSTVQQPSLSWKKNPANSYQWLSVNDILTVVIPDLTLANELILQQYGVSDYNALSQLLDSSAKSDAKRYRENEVAISGWQNLVDYNERLKRDAVRWPDFFRSLAAPSGSSFSAKASKNIIDQALNAAGSIGGTFTSFVRGISDPAQVANGGQSVPGANINPTSYQIASDGSVGSIAFFGGSSTLTFEMSSSSTSSADLQTSVEVNADTTAEINAKVTALGFALGGGFSSTFSFSSTQGTTSTSARSQSNTISIQFGDNDAGDHFVVEIWRDPVFGGPVYKLVSGRSRCPHEAGTINREKSFLRVLQPFFSHVNPNSAVTTSLTISNQSPTHETMQYFLNLVEESNTLGLTVLVNGKQLDSNYYSHNLIINVNYDEDVELSLTAVRGLFGYEFRDISIYMSTVDSSSGGASTGYCESQTASFTVLYDQNCNKAAFGGNIGVSNTFFVNGANINNGKVVLPIVIYNPEYNLKGRKWVTNFETFPSSLLSVNIQYRSASSVSDLDWNNILQVSSGASTSILSFLADQLKATGANADEHYFASWDVTGLSDGKYQLRLMAQCRVPLGAVDTSLYTYISSAVTGQISLTSPKLLGSPFPLLTNYLPGVPIQARFTKNLDCNGYAGRLKFSVLVSPTSVVAAEDLTTPQDAIAYCDGNIVTIDLQNVIWDFIIGRAMTVKLWNIFDESGNAASPVTWSFQVGVFNSKQSTASITGLAFTTSLTQIYSQTDFTDFKLFDRQFRAELASLINFYIYGTVPNSNIYSDLNGLQSGSIIISSIDTVSSPAPLSIDINPFPTFPSEPTPIYSPSFFANNLLLALNASRQQNSTVFPLLSKLTQIGSKISCSPVFANPLPFQPQANQHAHSQFHVESTQPAAYYDFHSSSGLSSDGLESIVLVDWSVHSANPIMLNVGDLQVSYIIRAAASNEITPNTILHLDSSQISLNQRTDAFNERAIYLLRLSGLPLVADGLQLDLSIVVRSANTLLYTINESVFSIGKPCPPSIISVSRSQQQTFNIIYASASCSGLRNVFNPADVKYMFSLTLDNGASIQVPNSAITFSEYVTDSFVKLSQASINVDLINTNQTFIDFPPVDQVASWSFDITTFNGVFLSSAASRSVFVSGPISPVNIYRVLQFQATSFLLNFPANPLVDIYDVSIMSAQRASQVILSVPANSTLLSVSTTADGQTALLLPVHVPASFQLLSSELASLQFAIVVKTSALYGSSNSQPRFVPVESPIVCPPPSSINILLFTAPINSSSNALLGVSWNAPTATGSNIVSFQLTYQVSDGFTTVQNDSAAVFVPYDAARNLFNHNLSVQLISNPIQRSLTVTVYVRAVLATPVDVYQLQSSNFHVEPFRSAPGSSSINVELPQINSTYSAQYPLEGPLLTQGQFVEAPLFLNATLIARSSRVSVVFSAVDGAAGYSLSYADVTSLNTPLNVIHIYPEQRNGLVYYSIHDSLFSSFTSMSLKFSVATVGANNALSQFRVNFLRIEGINSAFFVDLLDAKVNLLGSFSAPSNHRLTSSDSGSISDPVSLTFPVTSKSPHAHSDKYQIVFRPNNQKHISKFRFLVTTNAFYDVVAQFSSCSDAPSTDRDSHDDADIVDVTSCVGGSYSSIITLSRNQYNYLYVQLIAVDGSFSELALQIQPSSCFQSVIVKTMTADGRDQVIQPDTFSPAFQLKPSDSTFKLNVPFVITSITFTVTFSNSSRYYQVQGDRYYVNSVESSTYSLTPKSSDKFVILLSNSVCPSYIFQFSRADSDVRLNGISLMNVAGDTQSVSLNSVFDGVTTAFTATIPFGSIWNFIAFNFAFSNYTNSATLNINNANLDPIVLTSQQSTSWLSLNKSSLSFTLSSKLDGNFIFTLIRGPSDITSIGIVPIYASGRLSAVLPLSPPFNATVLSYTITLPSGTSYFQYSITYRLSYKSSVVCTLAGVTQAALESNKWTQPLAITNNTMFTVQSPYQDVYRVKIIIAK